MGSPRLLRALAALLLLAGLAPAVQAQRPGSIYALEAGPRSMVGDKKAAHAGDLLTVLIQESQDVQNKETSDMQKTDSLDNQLTAFNVKPDAFTVLPSVGGSMVSTFQGTANYQKQGSLQARITVVVVDALPNGNLVIQGRREIRVDRETKIIAFSGVVRRYDISTNNTVESELVANAKVSYVGDGPMTKSTNRTSFGELIKDFFVWLWPF